MAQCPHCHTAIEPGATRCTGCGRELGAVGARLDQVPQSGTLFGVRPSDAPNPFSSGPSAMGGGEKTVFGIRAITDDMAVGGAGGWDQVLSPGPGTARPAQLTPPGGVTGPGSATAGRRPAAAMTMMGLSALVPDDDDEGPEPTRLDAGVDDWLGEIEDFIGEGLADGSVALPGQAGAALARGPATVREPVIAAGTSTGTPTGTPVVAAASDSTSNAQSGGEATVMPAGLAGGTRFPGEAIAGPAPVVEPSPSAASTMILTPNMLANLQTAAAAEVAAPAPISTGATPAIEARPAEESTAPLAPAPIEPTIPLHTAPANTFTQAPTSAPAPVPMRAMPRATPASGLPWGVLVGGAFIVAALATLAVWFFFLR